VGLYSREHGSHDSLSSCWYLCSHRISKSEYYLQGDSSLNYLLIMYIMVSGQYVEADGWTAMLYTAIENCEKDQRRAERIYAEIKQRHPILRLSIFKCVEK